MNLVPQSLLELQDFQRGQDPKKSMGIGRSKILASITADDLQQINWGFNPDTNKWDEEEYQELFKDWKEEQPKEYKEIFNRTRSIVSILSGHMKMGEFVSTVGELGSYIREYRKSNPGWIPYDCHQDKDGWQVLWIDMELPNTGSVIQLL